MLLSLGAVVRRVLRPYGSAFHLKGPDIRLGEKATTSLALVFHELATNAAKYGALSEGAGTIAVDWRRKAEDLRIRWKETGGPETGIPAHHGFGSALVKATLSRLGGAIDYDWKKEGLCALITAPTDRLMG